MNCYIVSVKETWVSRYKVKANNAEEAKMIVLSGEMDEDYFPVGVGRKPCTYVEMNEVTKVEEL